MKLVATSQGCFGMLPWLDGIKADGTIQVFVLGQHCLFGDFERS